MVNDGHAEPAEVDVEDAIDRGGAQRQLLAGERLGQLVRHVLELELSGGPGDAQRVGRGVLPGREGVGAAGRVGPGRRRVPRRGRGQPQRLVWPLVVVDLPPAVELGLGVRRVVEGPALEQLDLERLVEPLLHPERSGLVDVRWVHVHDAQGTHRDQYFYSTDPTMTPEQILTLYTARWSIEVTFQPFGCAPGVVREHLGFETTKLWCRPSVTRAGTCLLGLQSLVTLIYAKPAEGGEPAVHATLGYAKAEPTFSDALFTVRRALWAETVLKQSAVASVVPKLPRRFDSIAPLQPVFDAGGVR